MDEQLAELVREILAEYDDDASSFDAELNHYFGWEPNTWVERARGVLAEHDRQIAAMRER